MKPASHIETVITPAVTALGFELVSCGQYSEGGKKILRVYIDAPQGVTVDDCTKASRQISAILNVEMPIAGQYNLEVSSPGLDRPLITPAHFQRFIGKQIKVKLHNALDERKNFSGELLGIDNNQVQILVDGTTFHLPLENIEKANLIPDLRF